MAAFNERIIGLSLTPVERHFDRLKCGICRQMIHLYAHRVETAGIRAGGGTIEEVFAKHGACAGWNTFDCLVMDDVRGLGGVSERITLAPRLSTIEGVQEINMRSGGAIVQAPAVLQTRNVPRSINSKNHVSLLVRLDRVHHSHVTGMSGSGDDIVLLHNISLVIGPLKIRPEHDGLRGRVVRTA